MTIKHVSETPVTIYHNPACGTSRKVLGYLRERGVEPHIIEYLKTPPDRATLESLLDAMGMEPRALIRRKGAVHDEMGLDNPDLTAAQLIGAMVEAPVLIERPIVATAKGTRVCRPAETVFDLL